MKTNFFAIVALLLFAGAASAQSMDKWPALKDLHTVMSQTFHPAEEGNLEPIKTRSEELMHKSAALLKSDVPADFRTNAILNSAEKLQLKTKAIHKLVTSKASDAEITKALSQAHDIFHEIVGLCTGEKH
ncbi:hypothetical protein [Flavobacterium caeni]|nr:hypothetical protein [Flavobacterium caeni]